jgi:hypothetical protein
MPILMALIRIAQNLNGINSLAYFAEYFKAVRPMPNVPKLFMAVIY